MRKLSACETLARILFYAPILFLKLFISYLRFAHRRTWAVYRFRKTLQKNGVPLQVARELSRMYEQSARLRSIVEKIM